MTDDVIIIPWVKIYDEVYEDLIVGNREGLIELKHAIEYAIENETENDADGIEAKFKKDFHSVLCVDEGWSDFEVQGTPSSLERIGCFVGVILITIWLVFLPIWGLINLFK